MTIREQLEREEQQRLSPYAMRSNQTAGRAQPMKPCDLRTCYQRDRDRIIHSKSFRRLKYKTQVFLSPLGDHYRTRLTHTLEVSQVARTLARCLRLNEDLTEAIALGHDLGHTPFGHIGERTLCELMPGGFRHNEQSRRVAEQLEKEGCGLNLCAETLDGIEHHSGSGTPSTLEGWCVRHADRIAYINHDIDDAIRGGILRETELPKHCIEVLGKTHGERIDTMIRDIVKNSSDRPQVCMSDSVQTACNELREFMFEHVYRSAWRKAEEQRCDYTIRALFDYYLAHTDEMPSEYLDVLAKEGEMRAVCDYIACMTDRYAVNCFEEHFVPNAFAVK